LVWGNIGGEVGGDRRCGGDRGEKGKAEEEQVEGGKGGELRGS